MVSRTEEGDVHVDAVELPATTSTAIFQSLVRIDSATDNAEGYLIEQSRHSRGDRLRRGVRKVSSILGPELMMPLAKALKQAGRQSVCIIALGPLALVPLHALSWRTADSATCLLDEFEIAYAPSAYIRGISKRRPRAEVDLTVFLASGTRFRSASHLSSPRSKQNSLLRPYLQMTQ